VKPDAPNFPEYRQKIKFPGTSLQRFHQNWDFETSRIMAVSQNKRVIFRILFLIRFSTRWAYCSHRPHCAFFYFYFQSKIDCFFSTSFPWFCIFTRSENGPLKSLYKLRPPRPPKKLSWITKSICNLLGGPGGRNFWKLCGKGETDKSKSQKLTEAET